MCKEIKPGPDSPYNPDTYPERAFKLSLLGLTDPELAFQFEVSEKTIGKWKKQHLLFGSAIKRGKTEADSEVAHATYKAACGFEIDSVHITTVSDGVTIGSHIVQTPIKKYFPPNVTAAIFWAKNRTRKNSEPWNNAQAIEHSGPNGKAIQVHKQIDLKDIPTDLLIVMRDAGIDLAESAAGNSRN